MTSFIPTAELPKDEFDAIAEWDSAPMMESGGDACGYRDIMYRPNRRAWGVRKGGAFVWAWVRGKNVWYRSERPYNVMSDGGGK